MRESSDERPSFVLVDDDDDDRLLMRMALEAAGNRYPMVELADGTELIAYLQQELARKGDQKMLWLVILDLNMPIMSGSEALSIMRQHPLWRHVPVLMLSTVDDQKYIEDLLMAGANNYIAKPTTFHGYIEPIKHTFSPWFSAQ